MPVNAKWAEVCCAIDVLNKDPQLKATESVKHFNILILNLPISFAHKMAVNTYS
jgi:hypothetical protein